jgi:hypothetical protein
MRATTRFMTIASVLVGLAAWSGASAQAYVYWTTSGPAGQGGTTLGRADIDGSGLNASFVSEATNPGPIAINSSRIYWGNDGDATIGISNLNGSDANQSFLSFNASTTIVGGLALDSTYVYWVNSKDGGIGRADLDGADPQPAFITAGSSESPPTALALSGGTLFYAEGSGLTNTDLYKVPATGGTPTLLATLTGVTYAVGLAAADGYVYWGGEYDNAGAIGRISTQPAQTPDYTYVTGLMLPTGVATDGSELYWADLNADQIGRAQIGATSATDIEQDFATDAGGPFGVAFDAGIDPTQTAVSCLQSTVAVNSTTTCTARVTDTASSSPPSGTVSFAGGAGTIVLGNPCTLGPIAGVQTCTVGIEPALAGTESITATYSGDTVHEGSSGSVNLCAGSATQCGAPPPPPPPPPVTHCIVPRLKGKSLAKARTLLSKAHCAVGKITRPKVRKGHRQPALVIGSTRPAAGGKLAAGTKIALRLVKKPSAKRR